MLWTAVLGARICPWYQEIRGALRVFAWKLERELNGLRTGVVGDRDPRAKLRRAWGWEWLGEGKLKTRDGTLNVGGDGYAAIDAVAMRAWRDELWRKEPRAKGNKTQNLDVYEPYIGAHLDLARGRDGKEVDLKAATLALPHSWTILDGMGHAGS